MYTSARDVRKLVRNEQLGRKRLKWGIELKYILKKLRWDGVEWIYLAQYSNK
jgi:hypothetical protein